MKTKLEQNVIEAIDTITLEAAENIIYTGCSNQTLQTISSFLKINSTAVVIKINKNTEQDLEKSTKLYGSRHATESIVADFLKNIIMLNIVSDMELIHKIPAENFIDPDTLKSNIELLCSGKKEDINKAEKLTPSYEEIFYLLNLLNASLNFILDETSHTVLQQAINIYLGLSSQKGFKTRIYTSNSDFKEVTTFGNVLTTPEDYIVVDFYDLLQKNASV